MKSITSFLLASICFISFSQTSLLSNIDIDGQSEYLLLNNVNKENQEKTEGTTYLNEDFVLGTISFKDGERSQANLLRYNALHDVFEVKTNDGKLMIVKQIEDVSVTLNNKDYLFINNSGVGGYFELIKGFNNGNKLLLKAKKKFAEAKKATSSYGSDKPAKYIDIKTILIYNTESDKMVPIENRKKSIINYFPKSQQSLIKKYIKKEKLKFKGDDYSSIIKVLEYSYRL